MSLVRGQCQELQSQNQRHASDLDTLQSDVSLARAHADKLANADDLVCHRDLGSLVTKAVHHDATETLNYHCGKHCFTRYPRLDCIAELIG